MKMRLFSSLIFSAICGIVSAQTLTVDDVEVMQGGTGAYALKVDVQGGTYTGVQFNVSFEPGFVIDTENASALSTWSGGSALPSELSSSGTGKVSCYSDKGKAIPDGSVILATIPFSTTAAIGEYTVNISNVVFMTEDIRVNAANTSFKIKVVDRLTIDEDSEVAPTATADKVNVHVARTINANNWSTIVLPFAMTQAKVKAAFGDDVLLGEFAGFKAEYASDEDVTPDAIVLNFTKVTMSAKVGMKAGQPYLIKTTKDIIDGFDVDEVQISNSITNVEKADEFGTNGSFVGTFTKASVPADALFISGNKFWYSTGTTETKGLRGWFALGAVLDKETDFGSRVIVNFIDDDATAIKGIKTDGEEEIYTLSGQRVNKAGKGVYIVNGKKVIKK